MPKIASEITQWFPYPDDPYEGAVLVRLPKGGELKAIAERTQEFVVKEFRSEAVIRMNDAKEARVLAAVKDWKNFLDVDGQQMKCAPANIRLMCKESGFVEFIDACIDELAAEAAKKKEAEAKNS